MDLSKRSFGKRDKAARVSGGSPADHPCSTRSACSRADEVSKAASGDIVPALIHYSFVPFAVCGVESPWDASPFAREFLRTNSLPATAPALCALCAAVLSAVSPTNPPRRRLDSASAACPSQRESGQRPPRTIPD